MKTPIPKLKLDLEINIVSHPVYGGAVGKYNYYLCLLFVWVGWVGFYGISTIVGYLMPNPFLYI